MTTRIPISALIALMLASTVALICVGFIPTLLVSLSSTEEAVDEYKETTIQSAVDLVVNALASRQVAAMSGLFSITSYPTPTTAIQTVRPLFFAEPAMLGLRCVSPDGDLLEIYRDGPQTTVNTSLFHVNTQVAGQPCKQSVLMQGVGTLLNSTTECWGDPRAYLWHAVASTLPQINTVPLQHLGMDRRSLAYPVGGPLRDITGSTFAVCAFEFEMERVFQVLRGMQLGGNGRAVAFFTGEGLMLAATIPFPRVSVPLNTSMADPTAIVTLLSDIDDRIVKDAIGELGMAFAVNENSTAGRYNTDGYWLSFRDIPFVGFSLRIMVIADKSDFLGDLIRTRNTVIAVVAVVFVFVMAIQVFIAVTLRGSITSIGTALADLAALDFGKKQAHEIESDKELSAIAEVAQLEGRVGQLQMSMHSFARYIPKEIVADMIAHGESACVGMTNAFCSSLFVDIEGFTSLTEAVPLDELSTIMELYYETQTNIILENGGTVDKFIGDCIMCMWGVPTTIDNPNTRAVATGVRLRDSVTMTKLKDDFEAVGCSIRVRVGISAGEVMAGNMGCSTRLNYTIIGDSVNLAARLEALNKEFRTRVLISENVNEHVRTHFCTRLLGAIQVYGKEVAVSVYEVIGVRPAPWSHQGQGSAPQLPTSSTDELPLGDLNVSEAEYFDSSTDGGDTYTSDSRVGRAYSRKSWGKSILSVSDDTRTRAMRMRKKRQDGVLRARDVINKCRNTSKIVNQDDEQFAIKYSTAMVRYMQRNFSGAVEELDDALAANIKNHEITELQETCRELMAIPPSSDWSPIRRIGK